MVEAESKVLKVVIEVRRAHGPLVRYNEPAFQQRGHPIQSNPAYSPPVLLICYDHQCLSFGSSAPFPTSLTSDILHVV